MPDGAESIAANRWASAASSLKLSTPTSTAGSSLTGIHDTNADIGRAAFSAPDDRQDLRDLLTNRRAQLIAGLLNLGPEFLSDRADLRLLLVAQAQIVEIHDRTGQPIAHSILALFLCRRELLLLLGRKDRTHLFELIPDDAH